MINFIITEIVENISFYEINNYILKTKFLWMFFAVLNCHSKRLDWSYSGLIAWLLNSSDFTLFIFTYRSNQLFFFFFRRNYKFWSIQRKNQFCVQSIKTAKNVQRNLIHRNNCVFDRTCNIFNNFCTKMIFFKKTNKW